MKIHSLEAWVRRINTAVEALGGVTAAALGLVPRGTLTGGYVAVTTDRTATAGQSGALTGLSVTVTLVTGRRYKVTANCYRVAVVGAGAAYLQIFSGSTQIVGQHIGDAVPGVGSTVSVVLTGTGSTTFSVRTLTSGTTAQVLAATDNPAFILVEDIGQ